MLRLKKSETKARQLRDSEVYHSVSIQGSIKCVLQAQKGSCVYGCSQCRVVKFSLSFIFLLTNKVCVDRKWDTKTEKWYEIIEFFISSNLQSPAGRKPSLSLTEGGLLQEEHTENTKISAPVRLQVFSHQFLRGWIQVGSLRITVVPCEFRGLGEFEKLRLARQ